MRNIEIMFMLTKISSKSYFPPRFKETEFELARSPMREREREREREKKKREIKTK